MDQKFRTSFIPKKPIATVESRPKSGVINLFYLFALIVFIGVIILAGGIFAYQKLLINSVESKTESLNRAREAFEPALIREISRLDDRINAAREILNKHTAPSEFFELLELSTLKNIQFEDLSYRTESDGRTSVQMRGKALSFGSVALQSDIFGKNKFISEPIFSDLDLDVKGNVIFSFSAFIEPELISYEERIISESSVDQFDNQQETVQSETEIETD